MKKTKRQLQILGVLKDVESLSITEITEKLQIRPMLRSHFYSLRGSIDTYVKDLAEKGLVSIVGSFEKQVTITNLGHAALASGQIGAAEVKKVRPLSEDQKNILRLLLSNGGMTIAQVVDNLGDGSGRANSRMQGRINALMSLRLVDRKKGPGKSFVYFINDAGKERLDHG